MFEKLKKITFIFVFVVPNGLLPYHFKHKIDSTRILFDEVRNRYIKHHLSRRILIIYCLCEIYLLAVYCLRQVPYRRQRSHRMSIVFIVIFDVHICYAVFVYPMSYPRHVKFIEMVVIAIFVVRIVPTASCYGKSRNLPIWLFLGTFARCKQQSNKGYRYYKNSFHIISVWFS